MMTLELHGFDKVKDMFRNIGHELSASQVRGILDVAGQIVAKEAKIEVELTGELGTLLKKDIGVYRDRRSSAKKAEYVFIGPRFKRYTIRNQSGQNVAVIAQHMTLGFNQTERETKGGQQRGRVARQEHNPVTGALQTKKGEVNSAIEKGVNKQLNKVKAKFPEVVK